MCHIGRGRLLLYSLRYSKVHSTGQQTSCQAFICWQPHQIMASGASREGRGKKQHVSFSTNGAPTQPACSVVGVHGILSHPKPHACFTSQQLSPRVTRNAFELALSACPLNLPSQAKICPAALALAHCTPFAAAAGPAGRRPAQPRCPAAPLPLPLPPAPAAPSPAPSPTCTSGGQNVHGLKHLWARCCSSQMHTLFTGWCPHSCSAARE